MASELKKKDLIYIWTINMYGVCNPDEVEMSYAV